MNTISYLSAEDKLRLKLCSTKGKKTQKIGRFRLWWDGEGNICALDIAEFTKELEEFRKKVTTIRLERIWKGAKITDEDIKEARQELLKQLEEKW